MQGLELKSTNLAERKVEAAKLLLSIKDAESSLYEFLKQAWPIIEGQNPFIGGWAIEAVCEHLEALMRREIKNLLINIPPRCTKSTLVSGMLPAWRWLHAPHEQFMYASYSATLSRRDSVKTRRIIQSKWYQSRWGNVFQLVGDQNTKIRFDNDQSGYRIASSLNLNATVTGDGGSVLVLDDPNNASDGESQAKRENTNDWLGQTWASRLNDFRTGVRLVIQQRIHEMDASGFLMNEDPYNDWTKLILPMEFETSRRATTIILPSTNGKIWSDPRTKEGELLWPERINEKELKKLKVSMRSEYRIAGQLQQRPAPAEGGIIKKSWWAWWKKENPPKVQHVIQSWDTALEAKDENAYSACTTWGIFKDDRNITNLILLSMWRGKVEYPELRKIAKRLYADYRDDGSVLGLVADGRHKPDLVLIEAKASGHSLVHDLHRANIPVIRFNPNKYGEKEERVKLVTHLIEAGKVWLPAAPPDYTKLRNFADIFCEKTAIFPAGESRDLVDTMTQVLLRLNASGWLSHPDDDSDHPSEQRPHAYY